VLTTSGASISKQGCGSVHLTLPHHLFMGSLYRAVYVQAPIWRRVCQCLRRSHDYELADWSDKPGPHVRPRLHLALGVAMDQGNVRCAVTAAGMHQALIKLVLLGGQQRAHMHHCALCSNSLPCMPLPFVPFVRSGPSTSRRELQHYKNLGAFICNLLRSVRLPAVVLKCAELQAMALHVVSVSYP
jgi:hypothetical protein